MKLVNVAAKIKEEVATRCTYCKRLPLIEGNKQFFCCNPDTKTVGDAIEWGVQACEVDEDCSKEDWGICVLNNKDKKGVGKE